MYGRWVSVLLCSAGGQPSPATCLPGTPCSEQVATRDEVLYSAQGEGWPATATQGLLLARGLRGASSSISVIVCIGLGIGRSLGRLDTEGLRCLAEAAVIVEEALYKAGEGREGAASEKDGAQVARFPVVRATDSKVDEIEEDANTCCNLGGGRGLVC